MNKIWDYKKARTDLINRFIENVDWSNLLLGKNVDELMEIFSQTILNIFDNFISNQTILRDERDPLWTNEKFKSLIKKKSAFYRNQRKSTKFGYTSLDDMILEVSNARNISKPKYHEPLTSKLNDPRNLLVYFEKWY